MAYQKVLIKDKRIREDCCCVGVLHCSMYGWGLSLKYFNLGFKFKSFPALGKFAVTCRCIQSCDIIHLQTLKKGKSCTSPNQRRGHPRHFARGGEGRASKGVFTVRFVMQNVVCFVAEGFQVWMHHSWSDGG